MAVQPGLCRTWSETPKTGFLTTRFISNTEEKVYFTSIIPKAQGTYNRILEDADVGVRGLGGRGNWRTPGKQKKELYHPLSTLFAQII